MDLESLRELDAGGYEAIRALSHDRPPPSESHAAPHAFVCSNGRTYWVKSRAQQGLLAELVAGRLASVLEVGPDAVVVEVSSAALPKDGSAPHLEGVGVGTEDFRDEVNSRDIAPFTQSGAFDPQKVDAASRANVVVFQTWIGAGDSQVLLNLTNGRVSSIDHGECFGNLSSGDPAPPVVTDIPGVDANVGRERSLVGAPIRRVEELADDELLDAVSRVPNTGDWRADENRRLEIALWLASRRTALRKVIEAWAT
jgi:hypothetical protein